ncbi:MAG TPA: hypothetical protein VNX21_04240 [Candidatus Thermoplasmatota archaeon]|nr:hypothetical protein [Candidatus Thermoplasmatota archaeon]
MQARLDRAYDAFKVAREDQAQGFRVLVVALPVLLAYGLVQDDLLRKGLSVTMFGAVASLLAAFFLRSRASASAGHYAEILLLEAAMREDELPSDHEVLRLMEIRLGQHRDDVRRRIMADSGHLRRWLGNRDVATQPA